MANSEKNYHKCPRRGVLDYLSYMKAEKLIEKFSVITETSKKTK